MKKIFSLLPWWGWVIFFAAIFVLWQSLSNWATSRKLYDMMFSQIQKDQGQTIKDKEAWIKECEGEIERLAKEKEQIQKEKTIWEKKGIESAKEIVKLKENNDVLKKKLQSIVISGDPDKLIDDLNKRGLSSIRRRGSRSN